VSSSLVDYAQALPITSSEPSGYDLVTFVGDLVAHAKSHLTQNAIVIPVLQTFNILIGGDALDRLSEDSKGLQRLVYNSEGNEMPLNPLLQPPRSSCYCTAKCCPSEKCREDPRVYEIVSSSILFGCGSLIWYSRVVNLLSFTRLSSVCVPRLLDFLAHPFPKVIHSAILLGRILTCLLDTNGHC
jgi:hypothetical protein